MENHDAQLLPEHNAGKNKRLNIHHPQSVSFACTLLQLSTAFYVQVLTTSLRVSVDTARSGRAIEATQLP